MIYGRVVIFIVFQMSAIAFASDEKKSIISHEDRDWLGQAGEAILQSQEPELKIASHIAFAVNHKELAFDTGRHLQKNIKHAQSWLRYFRKKSVLNEDGRLQFCKNLKDSVSFIKMFMYDGDNKDYVETNIFLKLFDYGINIEKHTLIKDRDSFVKYYHALSDHPSLVNIFMYFYNPFLDFFVTQENGKKSFLGVMVDSCWDKNTVCRYTLNDLMLKDFKRIFMPIMYEVTEKCVIKRSYQDVQKKVITCLCALSLWQKEKQIKIPRPVIQNLILNQCPDVVFLKYCNQVQQQVGSQIEWIKENDHEYYKNRLTVLPFLASPEVFKQWYGTLKYL